MNTSSTKKAIVTIPTKLNKDGKWEVTIEYADGLISVKTFPACALWKEMTTYISQKYGNCTYRIIVPDNE